MGKNNRSWKTGKDLRNCSSPVRGRTVITSGWGKPRTYRGRGATHQGVDIRAEEGTRIRAIGDGTVVKVVDNWKPGGGGTGGNYVSILHPGGIRSEYMHLSKVAVRKGEKITGGSYIGEAGKTGGRRSTDAKAKAMDPHLHLQVLVKQSGSWAKVDPDGFLNCTIGANKPNDRKLGIDLDGDRKPDVFISRRPFGGAKGIDLWGDKKPDLFVSDRFRGRYLDSSRTSSPLISSQPTPIDLDGDKKHDVFISSRPFSGAKGIDLWGDKKPDLFVSHTYKGVDLSRRASSGIQSHGYPSTFLGDLWRRGLG